MFHPRDIFQTLLYIPQIKIEGVLDFTGSYALNHVHSMQSRTLIQRTKSNGRESAQENLSVAIRFHSQALSRL